MFTFRVENERGDVLELTHNPAYDITSLDGIEPPEATINMTMNAGGDGSVFNSSRVENRQVTITLAVNSPAEENRINLYRFFKTKRRVRLYYANGLRDVYADGYVQNMTVGYFEKKEVVQIVVLCPFPYWKATENTVVEFAHVEPLFTFPFSHELGDDSEMVMSQVIAETERSVYNPSDIPVGVVIKLRATGTVFDPIITNLDTGEYFGIVSYGMVEGDVITIDTRDGSKSVTANHEGTVTSLVSSMKRGSSWFKLQAGDNVFQIDALSTGEENLVVSFEFSALYEGV